MFSSQVPLIDISALTYVLLLHVVLPSYIHVEMLL